MSEGPMAAVSCVTILTLVLLSLANLILLVNMVMESKKLCKNDAEFSDEFRYGPNRQFSHLVSPKQQQLNSNANKFMAALVLVKNNRMVLVCGTTIISKYWVLTTAQCCETVKIYALERIKIASNSRKWQRGIKRDVETIMRNANYSRNILNNKTPTHNVCLIKVHTPFSEKYETPIALASSKFRYEVDTTAATLGWSLRQNTLSDDLYTSFVNLISFPRCQNLLESSKIDETMVCAYKIGKIDCNYDSGGPLVQKDTVIGIVSFETDCSKKETPRVFTRMGYFEKWFQLVEKQNGNIRIGATFKP